MRKDVKFGLTVGAILLATIVIYVIVLTRGSAPGTASQNTELAQGDTPGKNVPGDQTGTSSNGGTSSTSGASRLDSGTNSVTAPDGHDALNSATAPGTSSSSGNSDVQTPWAPPAGAPTAADRSTPTTEPSSATADARTDWNTALTTGLPPTLSAAAPQRTQTPTIDSNSSANRFTGSVSRFSNPPLIDSLPTTQPAPPSNTSVAVNTSPDISSNGVNPMMLSTVDTQTNPGSNSSASANTIATDPQVNPSAAGTQLPARTHRITSGETLSSISAAAYGNAKYYKRLIAANPGVDPKHLKIGQMLNIPEANDDSEKNSSGSTSTEAAQNVDPSTAYVVKSGDTLEKIARRLYGDGQMQEKIYQANKALIGDDENVLKIGWVLKLPEAPTAGSSSR
jgi:nucleoid-associated protein YgaU